MAPRTVADARSPHRPARAHAGLRTAAPRWPLAVLEVAVAVVAALTLPRLEYHFGWHLGLHYDAATAQATLSAIAAGMITLTGFVLTAVTLMIQTVQNQSSRLLNLLNRTDNTPILFGTFTATFSFALLVLSLVHGNRVPTISVTVALIMVLVCASLFLRLLVTFRTTLTVGGLTRTIGGRLRTLIDVMYPSPFDPAAADTAERTGPPGAGQRQAWVLRHTREPGYFQAFNEPAVVRLAAGRGTVITFVPAVGDFVVTGAVLAMGTGPAPEPAALRRLIRVGATRTLEQDPAYGLRILVDIAERALSPAVNDPTSAVQALDQIDDILQRLAGRSLGDGQLLDARGRVLVRYPAPTWDAFFALAIDEILRYGGGSLQVTRRLRALLEDLLASAPAVRQTPVRARLAALERAVRREFPDEQTASAAARPDRQGIGSARDDQNEQHGPF